MYANPREGGTLPYEKVNYARRKIYIKTDLSQAFIFRLENKEIWRVFTFKVWRFL